MVLETAAGGDGGWAPVADCAVAGPAVEVAAGNATGPTEGCGVWDGVRADGSRNDDLGRELLGGQMTCECGIDQGAGGRAIEGRVSVKLDGNPGDALLTVEAQIQHLQDLIELAQIVGDQMDGKVRRLLDRIHAERAGGVEGSPRAMRLQLINLDSPSAVGSTWHPPSR